jgi:hypothetical protein
MHLTPSLSAGNHCQVALWFHSSPRKGPAISALGSFFPSCLDGHWRFRGTPASPKTDLSFFDPFLLIHDATHFFPFPAGID